MAVYFRDVTERKRLKAELEHTLVSERSARAEAERQGHIKDEFLATLSHELRTPLNAILGWSQILQRKADNVEQVRSGLTVIERNARMQTQIIEDLLDMSRIVSGTIRLDVQQIHLIPILDAAIDVIRPAADAKGITIKKILDPLAGPIRGDSARLTQVLWNVLSNAVKFTPKDGVIQVLLERVNSHIEISVSDTGVGITPEFLPHVFDKFRQADGSTTRRSGGLGLGLAIVKQLIELHGGQARAKSAGTDQGTTLIISLPLPLAHADAEDSHQHTTLPRPPRVWATDDCQAQLEGLSILIVDDEPDARDLCKFILSERNAIVHVAASADEAEAILDRESIDLLLSDIGMPVRDGYDLIRAVRMRSPDKGGLIPAVAMTAFARSEDRRRAMVSGFDMHLAKPVEPAELLVVITRHARRER